MLSIFTAWPTYAMIAAGVLAMFLLQSALNAGRLIAAQPGVTTADPVVSIPWGVLAFGETVQGGFFLLAAAAAVAGRGGYLLSGSPLVADTTPPSARKAREPAGLAP